MTVKIHFYGILREITKHETIEFNEMDHVEELIGQLEKRFPGISRYDFAVSVNGEKASPDRKLKNLDEITLIPPFEGG